MAGPPVPPNSRDWPYCEFLIHVPSAPSGQTLPVFNSSGYCASRDWQVLNTNDIIANYNAQYPAGNPTVLSTGGASVIVDWPRAWVFDRGVETTPNSDLILFSNGLAFGFVGFNTGTPGSSAYTPSSVLRNAVFSYDANDLIYQLTSPSGEVYVMQSYASFVDTSLTYIKLIDKQYMEKKIKLPAGWSYDVKVLTQGFDNVSTGNATIIQDAIGNSYMKVDLALSFPPVGVLLPTATVVSSTTLGGAYTTDASAVSTGPTSFSAPITGAAKYFRIDGAASIKTVRIDGANLLLTY